MAGIGGSIQSVFLPLAPENEAFTDDQIPREWAKHRLPRGFTRQVAISTM
jgi:hypothetical protein